MSLAKEEHDLEDMRQASLDMYRRSRAAGWMMEAATAAGQYFALSWALGSDVEPELQWIGSVALSTTKGLYKERKDAGANSEGLGNGSRGRSGDSRHSQP